CLGNNGSKRRFVVHSQIGQHTTIERDISLFQAGNQLAVGYTFSTRLSIDPGNPQSAEIALFVATVTIGILTGLDNSLFGHTEYTRTGTVITFCGFQNLLVTATRLYTTLYSS